MSKPLAFRLPSEGDDSPRDYADWLLFHPDGYDPNEARNPHGEWSSGGGEDFGTPSSIRGAAGKFYPVVEKIGGKSEQLGVSFGTHEEAITHAAQLIQLRRESLGAVAAAQLGGEHVPARPWTEAQQAHMNDAILSLANITHANPAVIEHR